MISGFSSSSVCAQSVALEVRRFQSVLGTTYYIFLVTLPGLNYYALCELVQQHLGKKFMLR